MIILSETTNITDYVGYDTTSAWQVVFDWFLERGNVSAYFNINGNVFHFSKDERGYYTLEQQCDNHWVVKLSNRTKKWLVEEIRHNEMFLS